MGGMGGLPITNALPVNQVSDLKRVLRFFNILIFTDYFFYLGYLKLEKKLQLVLRQKKNWLKICKNCF